MQAHAPASPRSASTAAGRSAAAAAAQRSLSSVVLQFAAPAAAAQKIVVLGRSLCSQREGSSVRALSPGVAEWRRPGAAGRGRAAAPHASCRPACRPHLRLAAALLQGAEDGLQGGGKGVGEKRAAGGWDLDRAARQVASGGWARAAAPNSGLAADGCGRGTLARRGQAARAAGSCWGAAGRACIALHTTCPASAASSSGGETSYCQPALTCMACQALQAAAHPPLLRRSPPPCHPAAAHRPAAPKPPPARRRMGDHKSVRHQKQAWQAVSRCRWLLGAARVRRRHQAPGAWKEEGTAGKKGAAAAKGAAPRTCS